MRHLFIVLCLLLMAPALCHAQGSVGYSYDAAGNRISRTIILSRNMAKRQSAKAMETREYTDRISLGEVRLSPNPTQGLVKVSITGMSNDSTSVAYTYNPYGWVTQETRSIAGDSDIVFEYTYDSYGRLSGKTCQPVGTVSYVYDQNGHLRQYKVNNDTQWTLMEEYGTETVFYTPTMIAREYHDSGGFLSGLSLSVGATPVHEMTFMHDGTTGNLTQRTGMRPFTETFRSSGYVIRLSGYVIMSGRKILLSLLSEC